MLFLFFTDRNMSIQNEVEKGDLAHSALWKKYCSEDPCSDQYCSTAHTEKEVCSFLLNWRFIVDANYTTNALVGL